MTYTRNGVSVRLDMTSEDFDELLLMTGYAAGGASRLNLPLFWRWIRLANKMNATNPNFTPYEIPEEYRRC